MKGQTLTPHHYKSSFKALSMFFEIKSETPKQLTKPQPKQNTNPQPKQNNKEIIKQILSSKSETEIAMLIRKARDLATEKGVDRLEDPILNFLLQYFLDNVGTIEEMARSLKRKFRS
jgi:hypothetical protein